jgi:glycosyltransferase involved in cell wall biosynthesis
MHVAVVIPHLGPGGAERVASLLCNCWIGLGHSVTAITFDAPGVESFFSLDSSVQRRQIDALNSEGGFLSRASVNARRLWRVRSALKAIKPNVVVAFMTEASVVTVCAAFGLGVPIIVTERNQPDRPGLGRLRRLTRRLAYPWASAIIVQTSDIARWANTRFRLPVHVLPNPVQISERKPVPRRNQRMVVAAGRLVHQKGFDILIDSFASVAQSHPNWRLIIYGEGPERVRLQAQIEQHSLSDRISLAGLFTEFHTILGQADLFVLASRFEGYPNVLLEALSLCRPVIATDCPGATSAILDGGRYGLLVQQEDSKSLAEALDCMMSNAPLRRQYAALASHAVADLDVGKIGRRWLDVFSSLQA